MATYTATSQYAEQIVEDVRRRIAVEDPVLREAFDRRRLVQRLADQFDGALRSFGSGSLAHRTVNRPLNDADMGLVLDRRHWPALGPDGSGLRAERTMEIVGYFVCERLRADYPQARYDAAKRRAVLFTFNTPVHGVDPTVDLVLCLTRRDAPGFWIPNTKSAAGWDASDPETHTRLMTGNPKDLRVYRARLVRLAKAAITSDTHPVMCPWNISALALTHVTSVESTLLPGLADFLSRAAADISMRLTPDPARVAGPIELPSGIDQVRASHRLNVLATHCSRALAAQNRQDALNELVNVFPDQLPEAPRSRRRQIAEDLRPGRSRSGAAAAAFGSYPKTTRSDGCA